MANVVENKYVSQNTRKQRSLDVPKVNKLDGLFLDDELFSFLKQQIIRIFKYIPFDFVLKREIEIDTFIQLTLFYFTIYKDKPSNGDVLQNLTLNKPLTFKKKIYYLLLTILIPYLWKKLCRHMTDYAWHYYNYNSSSNIENMDKLSYIKHKIYIVCNKLNVLIKILSLLHLILFLYDGKYRNIIERMLNINLVIKNKDLGRMVTFDFMNQALIWSSIANFLLFVVPLINFPKIYLYSKGFIIKMIYSMKMFIRVITRKNNEMITKDPNYIYTENELKRMDKNNLNSNKNNNNTNNNNISVDKIMSTECGLCGLKPITIPVKSDCNHLFCYYCGNAELLHQNGMIRCPICYEMIDHFDQILPTHAFSCYN